MQLPNAELSGIADCSVSVSRMKPRHATRSSHLAEQLVRTLAVRASRERRTVSQVIRLLLSDVLASAT